MEIIKNNKVIVRKEDASKKVFKGVSLDSLAVGEKSMVAKMYYVKGNFASTHQHPHEQCGYVISGEYRLNMEMPEEKLVFTRLLCFPHHRVKTVITTVQSIRNRVKL